MAVIPSSQLDLGRQRKRLEAAFEARDWGAVQRLDQSLVASLGSAVDDPQRELGSLLQELRVVVGLYRTLLQSCDASVQQAADQLT